MKSEKANGSPRITYGKKEPTPQSHLNLEIQRNIYDQSGKEITSSKDKKANGDGSASNGRASAEVSNKALEDIAKENKKPVFCSSCGIDCTRLRYHYGKSMPSVSGAATAKIQYDLCPVCYLQHRWPENQSAIQFVKLEEEDYSRVPERNSPWSDKEVLLLLEALEEDLDDWNKISDYVGTRTREECVVKFLSLEIEDKYLENEPDTFAALDSSQIPLSQADNPVMSVVGFLAGMADPGIAAAAAGRWINETQKSLRQRLEKGVGGETVGTSTFTFEDKDKNVKADHSAASDVMDVDQPSDTNQISTRDDSRASDSLPTIALAASAARASALASNEERQHTQLISAALNSSLEKIDMKLQQFREMEQALDSQRQDLERGRRDLFMERASFTKRMMDVEAQLANLGVGGNVVGIEAGSGERMAFSDNKLGSGEGEPMDPGASGVKGYGS